MNCKLNQTGSCVAGCHPTSAAERLNFSCLQLQRVIKAGSHIIAAIVSIVAVNSKSGLTIGTII